MRNYRLIWGRDAPSPRPAGLGDLCTAAGLIYALLLALLTLSAYVAEGAPGLLVPINLVASWAGYTA